MAAGVIRRVIIALAALALWPASAAASLWNKPTLVNPTTIDLSATADSTYHDSYRLDGSKDYVLKCPVNPVVMPNWFEVIGGHNVVIAHCRFQSQTRALKLQDTQGTVWVRDVHFEAMAGAQLSEGIDLQEPTPATVVLRDVLIDELHGSYAANHADCVQTWSGPWRFLIDGLGCLSGYQGFFLTPNQHDATTNPDTWDLRHVDIRDNATSLWLGNLNEPAIPTWNVDHVYATPLSTWNGTTQPNAWANAAVGPPPDGPYVWPVSSGAKGISDLLLPKALPSER